MPALANTLTPVGLDADYHASPEATANASTALTQTAGEHQRTATKASPLVGLLTISGLLLPIAFVPFLALRRRLVRIETRLDKLVNIYDTSIRDELHKVRIVQESHQKWLQSLNRQLGSVSTLVESNGSIQKDLVRGLEGVTCRLNENDERHKRYVEDGQSVRATLEDNSNRVRDVQSHIQESIARSTTKYDRVLGRLGNSLADVAAFIHETEVRHGIIHDRNAGGSQRVEALRTLGYDLHSLSKDSIRHSSDHRVKPISSTE